MFGYIEMGRISRQIEYRQPSFCPAVAGLLNDNGFMDRSIIYHNRRWFDDASCQTIKLFVHKSGGDASFSRCEMRAIIPAHQGKTTQGCPLCCRHKRCVLFLRKLPDIWHSGSLGNIGFIAIEEVYCPLLGKTFQCCQRRYFVGVFFRIGRITRAFAEAFVSTAIFFKKRLRVFNENSFSNASCASTRASFSC